MINITLLSEKAIIPSRRTEESAGLDFHTIESVTIPPGHRALLKTGISMSIPEGFVGLLWPRSKLASKLGLDTLAGVIDSDYRGEVMVSLLNTGFSFIEIKSGDKVAQMIIQNHSSHMQINVVDKLDNTMRGKEGINSTEMRLR
jgi:dUTP pyrophosphatase